MVSIFFFSVPFTLDLSLWPGIYIKGYNESLGSVFFFPITNILVKSLQVRWVPRVLKPALPLCAIPSSS